MKTKTIIFIVIISVVLTATLSVVGTLTVVTVYNNRQDRFYIEFDASEVDPDNIAKFNEVRDLLEEKFLDYTDENELLEGAIAGMADSFDDPYTMYVDKETWSLMTEDSEGEYSGVGVTIQIPTTGVGILALSVNELGPAHEAGVLPGDRIVKVDDYDVTYSEDLSYVASIVRGDVGTDVKLEVIREGENEPLIFTITRRIVNSIEVTGEMLEGDTGYISLSSFSQDSPQEFLAKFNELGQAGMDSVIIDLRDNPGGSLGAIIAIADMLMDDGIITYTIDRDNNRDDYTASGKGVTLPIIVLVNEYSASASEMLAGALRDNGYATVIGTTTYGKGLVQGVYELEDGSGIRITIAKYYTPSGVCIQDIGVVPDIEIEPLDDYINSPISAIPFEDDVQLQRALEEIGAYK
ncbi:MAG: S41 family peptidase [Clostridiales bacterium]|nr:S41 family peptidase [Clostridiales bacterium]